MESLSNHVLYLVQLTDRPRSKGIARLLWYSLADSELCKNIYRVRMPYLVRVVSESCCPRPPQGSALVLPDCDAAGILGLPSSLSLHKTIFLVSVNLCMQIKERMEDTTPPKRDIWKPPKDFDMLACEAPVKKCYIEVFLDDFRYVSGQGNESLNNSLLETVLGKSPILQSTWAEFKKTFLTQQD